MRTILFFLIAYCTFGCAISGTQTIHSPNAKNSDSIWERNIHCGVDSDSPPNAIELQSLNQDSLSVIIKAQILTAEEKRGGIIVPFIPMLFSRTINFYKDQENSLILFLRPLSYDELAIDFDSIQIRAGKESYGPSSISYKDEELSASISFNEIADSTMLSHAREGYMYELDFIELQYPIDAFNLETFELNIVGIARKNEISDFATIIFHKTDQKTLCFGP